MKLELNVKRFNNEDVIATSGVCSHIGTDKFDSSHYFGYANHIKIDVDNDNLISYVDNNQDGKLEISGSMLFSMMKTYQFPNEFVNVSANGWYYWNKDTQTFEKCCDNCDHPIEDN